MYIQNSEFQLRTRLEVIRDRATIWAIAWIVSVIVFFGLSIWLQYVDHGKAFGVSISLALMISCVGVIVMVQRVSRFSKYRLNRTTEFSAKDHKRIYGENKKEKGVEIETPMSNKAVSFTPFTPKEAENCPGNWIAVCVSGACTFSMSRVSAGGMGEAKRIALERHNYRSNPNNFEYSRNCYTPEIIVGRVPDE